MSDTKNSQQIPVWFWVVSALALVWNLMGIMAYIQQVTLTPEALAAMSAAEQKLYNNTPSWVNGAFAIAVFGGGLGCLLLLLKKAFAQIIFIISLLAILTQMGYVFFVSRSIEVFGPGRMLMPIMIIVIAVLLVWFAKSSKQKGWIK